MKVIVIGAGLGGLSASIALGDAGVDAPVFERARTLEEIQVGVGMVLWPNGLRALRSMRLADEVKSIGSELKRVEFTAASGERLNTWDVAEVGRRVGEPAVALSRGQLHALLARVQRERGGSVGLQARAVDFETVDGHVSVRFDGGDEQEANVLVAADGVASTIRRKLTGKGPPDYPPYANYTIWHAIIPFGLDEVARGVFFLLFGRGSRFAYYRLDDERVYWSGIAFVEAGGQNTISKPEVLEAFAAYGRPVRALIEATAEQDIQRHDIYGGEVLERWGSGRVTLLGDAAHPMTTNLGQGAGMAVEDAVVLRDCLEQGSDPERALRAYEQRRKTRTDEMMALANKLNSTAALEGRFRCWARNTAIKLFFQRALGRKYDAFITADF